MEEVAAQQHKVGVVARRYLKYFLERHKRVILAHLILLPNPLRTGRVQAQQLTTCTSGGGGKGGSDSGR